MESRFRDGVSSVLLWTAGAWIGVVLFLGYGVAGTLFGLLESRTLAGELNGAILLKMNRMEWAFAGMLIVASGTMTWRRRTVIHVLQFVLAVLAAALLYVYSVPLTQEIESVKKVVLNFDLARAADLRPERVRFDELHAWYSGLVKANLLVLVCLSVLTVVARVRHET